MSSDWSRLLRFVAACAALSIPLTVNALLALTAPKPTGAVTEPGPSDIPTKVATSDSQRLVSNIYAAIAQAARRQERDEIGQLLHPDYPDRDEEIDHLLAAKDTTENEVISDVRVESRRPGRLVLVASVLPHDGSSPLRQRVLLLDEGGVWRLGGVETVAGEQAERPVRRTESTDRPF